ncbi:AT-rich interactive domain-containing protein 5B-like [Thunnus albacares]|uniref:AT-rich interactive domain-containing protein 5B-like n=1 Tax=Thunnus maccoyii TaxID=8240 RepID=UPI001C4B5361|nr:AT-rich interactive domain-containing protein 5B-like [Thunnus maccoyii]XP_044229187.1 AT-rich interactive domain-containing protein 5B-like [Thunnus albacares]
MEPNSLKWVGSSCGLHGPYIFYKAFKFNRDGKPRILSLGDFFFVRCKPEDPICIAELQLLWEERTSKQLLSSSKLYFLPEDTPQGRTVTHGEHEVIAVSEKVIVRLEDLVKWTVPDFSGWAHGLKAEPLKASVLLELGTNGRREALHRYRESTLTSGLNFKDVQRERAQLGQEEDGRKVLVLSYPQYCRYRSVLARLREQPSSLFIDHTVLALGGIAALGGSTRILYCRDTFEHPALLQNESICDEFAPNLKGRPRKKKLSISQRRDSPGQAQGQGSSGSSQGSTAMAAQDPCSPESKSPKVKPNCKVVPNGKITSAAKHKANGLSKKSSAEEKERGKDKEKEKEERSEEEKKEEETSEESRAEEQAFLVELYKYMKDRDTPIERIPFLGFKQINLWTMFQAAQKLGGYELITVRRQWKHVYDELGGNPSSTSAATCTRRHYERLLLPYERHIKGEQDKPLPLAKPRKEGVQEKTSGAKSKGVGAKKLKIPNNPKQGNRRDRGETVKGQEQSQDSKEKEENHELSAAIKHEASLRDEPIVIEEEELHLTLKKEESLAVEQPSSLCPKEPDCRTPHAGLPLHTGAGPQPEWRQISEALQAKLTHEQQTEGHFIPKNAYLPHRWDHNKPAGHVALPEPTSRVKDSTDSHGGRVGKVLPMCKQADRQAVDLSTDSLSEKEDFGVIKKESIQGPAQTAAYCKASQGVMSPLAKKKLLSQVCESNPFSFTSPSLQPPHPTVAPSLPATSGAEREKKRKGEEEVAGQRHGCVSDNIPEVAPIFRPSVIQHAQSSKPHQQATSGPSERSAAGEISETFSCRTSHHLQPQVNPPWQPYLPRTHTQEGGENAGEKLLQGPAAQTRSYAGDCYSSPHLHSLYRQTENCLSQERMAGFPNGEQREHYTRDREGSQGFVCSSLEQEGLAYRSHYSDRTQTHRDSREAEDEPRDFTISKPHSQRVSTFSKPSFCSLPYPIMHQGLDSHPKACRVPPMTISPPKQSPAESSQPFPSPKASSDASLTSPIRPSKRSLLEPDNEEVPERKVRVVTPIHPACAIRRSDPEELKPAEPAHAVHLNNHLPEGHPTTTYPPHHAAPLYAGMYPPGSLVSPGTQDGLQQHPGLQYLKSQSAVSPLVPPLAFHSMMLHRQLLASSPSPHHFYRHPGGAALYGDLLHHLYPLSTLPPPQLSSVHPSTRL